jgi:tight adherence protein C
VPPLLLGLLLVLTAAACFTLYQAAWGGHTTLADRLSRGAGGKREVSGHFSALVRWATRQWPSGPQARSPAQRKLHSTLAYAGFRSVEAPAVFQLARAGLMIGLAVIGFALSAAFHKSLFGTAALGSLLGFILPSLVIRRLARSRQRRIFAELPDVLALLVVSLEAGIGFNEVIKLVGREAERQGRVLGQELSATASQMTAGRSMEDSLKDLGDRTGLDEVKSLVALAIQSEKVGARLASALRASADLLNSQRRLAAEEAAHKTAVKMLIPLVFLILPAMMLVILGPAIIQIMRMFSTTM